MKYPSCDRRYLQCDAHNTPFNKKNISCLVTGIKKQHLVSQYIYPVNERIFLVTGNKLPVKGRTNNTLCHMKNISWRRTG